MNIKTTPASRARKLQNGIALLSALLILIVITVVSIAIGSGGRALQKSVTAHEDLGNALAAAETTMRLAERAIKHHVFNGTPAASPACAAPTLCFVGDFDSDNNWWKNDSAWLTQITLGAGALYGDGQPLKEFNANLDSMTLAGPPQFRVEVTSDPTQMRKLSAAEGASGLRLHQITVRGQGRGQAEVVLQSVYGVMVE